MKRNARRGEAKDRSRRRTPTKPARRTREVSGSPWELQHSPYTPEGNIEGARKFAEGAANARGWRRTAVLVVAWMFPAFIGLGLLIELIKLIVELLS